MVIICLAIIHKDLTTTAISNHDTDPNTGQQGLQTICKRGNAEQGNLNETLDHSAIAATGPTSKMFSPHTP